MKEYLKMLLKLTLSDISERLPEVRWEFKRPFVRGAKNFGKAFEQLFDDTKSFLYELFVQIPKDIKTFAKNCWAFKGLLWQDRNWDHVYILRFLQFKIKRTRQYIEKHQRHTRWKRDVKDMLQAEEMIRVILEDRAGAELFEAHDAKWGKSHHKFIPLENGTGSLMRTLREKVHTPEEQAQELKEYRAILKKSWKLEEKHWNRLWKHLDKNMRNWWD